MISFRESRIHIGFFILSLTLAGLGWAGYRLPERQAEQTKSVARAHETLGVLTNLSNHLADAETGQRDYMLTGKSEYLELYTLAAQGLDGDITRFQQMAGDNPRLQTQAPSLRLQIEAGLTVLQQGLDQRKFLSQEDALKMVVFGRAKAPIELVQQHLDQMLADERLQLKQRTSKANAAAVLMRWALLGSGALGYVLLGFVYAGLLKGARQRKKLETAVQRTLSAQLAETERLTGLMAAQSEVESAQHLQTAMQSLAERAREIVHATGAVVELAEGDAMVCRAACGSMALQLNLRLNPAASLSAQSVLEDALLMCDDTETDDRIDRDACRKVGTRSMMAVPLRQDGKAIGVLQVMSSRANAFTEQDAAALELAGGLLSSAIVNVPAVEALRACRERLAEAQAAANMGSWEFDLATSMSTWSQGMFRLAGMDPEAEAPDYTAVTALFAPEDGTRLSEAVQRALREGIAYSLDLQQADAEEAMPRSYHAVGWPVMDAQGSVTGLAGTFTDTTAQRHPDREIQEANAWLAEANSWLAEANTRLETQAVQLVTQSAEITAQEAKLKDAMARLEALETTDGLTGLKNHRIFQERLAEEHQRALRYGTPLSLIMLDIDDFKQFNDDFGHPTGDGALKRIAGALESTARSTDIVARYGGEEFAVLLPETDAIGAVETAERIRQTIAGETREKRTITVSVGAATLDASTATPSNLLKAADMALYQSKTQGRNRVTHIGGAPWLSDSDTPQVPAIYMRRFKSKLGEDRPSRRLLDKLEKAA
jgi:diguanylate cyclase (GGDEF)-like protein